MYKLLLLINLLLMTGNLFSVIAGISCLEEQGTNQKIVLLHDCHENVHGEESLTAGHQQELATLIDVLSKKGSESSFFVEYPHRTTNFKFVDNTSTVYVPIKDALAHDFQHGSVVYKSFDEREEPYFWLREMTLNYAAIQDNINNDGPFPVEYKNLTVGMYVEIFQQLEKQAQLKLQNLPLPFQEIFSEKIGYCSETYNMILQQAHDDKIDTKAHFFDLVQKLVSKMPLFNKFFVNFTRAQSVYSDMYLLSSILRDKNKIVVVHAGAYHTCMLEKSLLLTGYANHDDFKNGLNVEDLDHVIWPKNISASFIKHVYGFLALCDNCGIESLKKCSSCKKAYYCSVACQKKSWQQHKLSCYKSQI